MGKNPLTGGGNRIQTYCVFYIKKGNRMVWIVEKKVFRHCVDLSFERLEIPVRVKFEFEIKDGTLVPDSLSFKTLYNRKILKNRYPQIDFDTLDQSIEKTVNKGINNYMKKNRYLV